MKLRPLLDLHPLRVRRKMRKRWILALVFLSVLLPVFMHLWPRDRNAVIHPFPFYESLPIHPQSWANLWLQRLRMFPLLIILLVVIPPLRAVFACYLVFEAVDVADWFLRYGQDILVPGFDLNVIKITAVTVTIACYIITYINAKRKELI
jgi:hypothetical protein